MKTNTFLKIALTVTILFGLMISPALDQASAPDRFNTEIPGFAPKSDNLVKGIIVDGVVYPSIQLPTVEITGELNTDDMVRGEVIRGEVVPSILLDEVIVVPNS